MTCMLVYGSLDVGGMVLLGVIVVFSLPFPFSGSHGMLGCLSQF